MADKAVNPGSYNRRVSFQKRTEIVRPGGDNQIVWYRDDAFDVWASVVPMTGREYIFAGAMASPDIIRVRTWYRTDVSAQDYRLVYNGKVFNIETVIDVGAAHREMELVCTEESGAAAASERPAM